MDFATNTARLALAVALVTAGCDGRILAPGASGAGSPAAPRGPDFEPGRIVPPSVDRCEGVTEAPPTVLTRLTRVELRATLRDLIGDGSAADALAEDEAPAGFAFGAVVTSTNVEQWVTLAYAVASSTVATRLGDLVPCASTGDEACARSFLTAFLPRAFRRPVEATEVDRMLGVYRVGAMDGGFRAGIELALAAILGSPSFLYHREQATLASAAPIRPGARVAEVDAFELANRLSYFLWRSMPDDRLFEAARAGRLSTPDQIEVEARRMLADPKAREAFDDFSEQWLEASALRSSTKDRTAFPEWSSGLANALVDSLVATVAEIAFDATDRSFTTLLSGDVAVINEPIAELYGVAGVRGSELVRTDIDAAERAGILTHPGLLALNAKPNQTSPVHRGHFVRERLLCEHLVPPPGLIVEAPNIVPGTPTRERFAEHANDASCSGCHRKMDPIGFGFEAFDAIGRHRTLDEGGSAIDASGEVVEGGDASGTFNGARELAGRLSGSELVQSCFARQVFRWGTGRTEHEVLDRCSLSRIVDRFTRSGGDLRELLVGIAVSDAFRYRAAGGAS